MVHQCVCVACIGWNQLSTFQLIFNLQAVVVSIDPRRVYVKDPNDVQLKTIRVSSPGEELVFFSFSLFYILWL